MNWITELLQNLWEFIWELIFPKPTHIVVPAVVSGSPDWVQSATLNQSQSWLSYLSLPYRTQWEQSWDEDNCATRAAIEIIEALLNYYKDTNSDIVSDFIKKELCNPQGYVKLSIRYNAKLNNTTAQGVSVQTVIDNFAIYGIVPESLYPDPPTPFTWNDYYSPVPQKIIDFGKNTLTLFKIIFNPIWNNNWNAPDIQTLRNNLTLSPVYFASCVGTKLNGIEQNPHKNVYQHARCLYFEDQYQEVLDSYDPYLVKLSQDFPLGCALQMGVKII